MALRRPPIPVLILVAIVGLTALYAQPLATRFLNDDYVFLEGARATSLAESLTEMGPLGNFYRPLSRQVYFEALTPIAGGDPRVFHLANYLLFLAALALLFDLLRALLPAAGAMAGSLFFALLPLQRVNLTWVSCAQELLALAGTLGAVALVRRGRAGWALLPYAAAVASKEAALPLPLVLVAWEYAVARRALGVALLRAAPFAALGLAWGSIALAMRASAGVTSPVLRFDPEHFAAGYVHLAQSLIGLEHPPGLLAALLAHPPPLVPLICLGGLAIAWPRGGGQPVEPAATTPAVAPRPRVVAAFAVAWIAAFGLAVGPVAAIWSSYHYTLAACGGAILVGLLFRRGRDLQWIALTAGLLWWHTAAGNVRAFAVAEGPWVWTSHLTSAYFQRGAALADSMSRQLRRIEPAPPSGTRFFFATLPSWAGFQMGNGALIRHLYRDSTLRSHFYSEYSESTAADRPARFLYWDGAALAPLYPGARDPHFQVGSDLLLLDRPAGAAHAFRRGLQAGGDRMDLLYWLGWAELWLGRRATAEGVWSAFGARDDSLRWLLHLHAARALLVAGDTVEARRNLVRANEYGIGRPQGHSILGSLLLPVRPKYGLLELKVATWLDPHDATARRDLFLGLVDVRLDEAARREFETLEAQYPGWREDRAVREAHAILERRSLKGRRVVEF